MASASACASARRQCTRTNGKTFAKSMTTASRKHVGKTRCHMRRFSVVGGAGGGGGEWLGSTNRTGGGREGSTSSGGLSGFMAGSLGWGKRRRPLYNGSKPTTIKRHTNRQET